MSKRLLILVLFGVLLISGLILAQDDAPEGCELPALDDAMADASDALAEGDMVAYLDTLGDVAMIVNESRKACLQGAAGEGVDLSGVTVTHGYLSHNFGLIYLGEANLQGANLERSVLIDAFLYGANLQEANLFSAVLSGGYLEQGDFQHAVLDLADVTSARLRGANLQDASFSEADLSNSDMREASLQRAYLMRATLRGTDLSGANMHEAIIAWANFQGANLTNANLQDAASSTGPGYGQGSASATECDFRGANLTGANLEGTQIGVFIFDEATVLPDGTNWTADTDMTRFSDPEHADFWRSDDPNSPAYAE